MSWETPLPDTIVVPETETGFKPVSAGKHTFSLLPGSGLDTNGRLNINVAVAEGEEAGRRVFPSLPSSAFTDGWGLEVIERLSQATGVDRQPGENAIEFLNRVAANGNARFKARTYHKQYAKKTDEPGQMTGVDVRLDYRSISPAA
jgi:hypothetical protein